MAQSDDLLAAIETIHAAGLDTALWPNALAATARLIGGTGATLETYGPMGQVLEWHGAGIPPAEQLDYVGQYAAINPRAAYGFRHPEVQMLWDYQILDEAAMDRDPYYSEFLPRTDFRYFLSARLSHTSHEIAIATIQRTRAQGHATPEAIALMERLVPHLRQARDVASRLKRTDGARASLADALDWLKDGVAVLGRDGAVLYANEAMQEIFRRKDGIALKKGAFSFQSPDARNRFAAALNATIGLRANEAKPADFPVARAASSPPYLVSLRPLASGEFHAAQKGRGAVLAFVRDPARRDAAAIGFLVEVFGLTPAEAGLARAIQAGISLADYSRARAVSLNTIYTHLRRIKEKTGCSRMSELVRKFNDLQMPLRID